MLPRLLFLAICQAAHAFCHSQVLLAPASMSMHRTLRDRSDSLAMSSAVDGATRGTARAIPPHHRPAPGSALPQQSVRVIVVSSQEAQEGGGAGGLLGHAVAQVRHAAPADESHARLPGRDLGARDRLCHM